MPRCHLSHTFLFLCSFGINIHPWGNEHWTASFELQYQVGIKEKPGIKMIISSIFSWHRDDPAIMTITSVFGCGRKLCFTQQDLKIALLFMISKDCALLETLPLDRFVLLLNAFAQNIPLLSGLKSCVAQWENHWLMSQTVLCRNALTSHVNGGRWFHFSGLPVSLSRKWDSSHLLQGVIVGKNSIAYVIPVRTAVHSEGTQRLAAPVSLAFDGLVSYGSLSQGLRCIIRGRTSISISHAYCGSD